jgi:hypothetical protein
MADENKYSKLVNEIRDFGIGSATIINNDQMELSRQ